MIEVTLPDGSKKPFDHPVTAQDVAAAIGAGLAKATLAGKVDGKLVDASAVIDHDARLEIVTEKSPEALEILRHSTAHLLAQAVQRLYPGAQVGVGRMSGELRQAGFLQRRVVVIVVVVDAEDFVAAREQTLGECGADEAGGTRDEDAHPLVSWWGRLILAGRPVTDGRRTLARRASSATLAT